MMGDDSQRRRGGVYCKRVFVEGRTYVWAFKLISLQRINKNYEWILFKKAKFWDFVTRKVEDLFEKIRHEKAQWKTVELFCEVWGS